MKNYTIDLRQTQLKQWLEKYNVTLFSHLTDDAGKLNNYYNAHVVEGVRKSLESRGDDGHLVKTPTRKMLLKTRGRTTHILRTCKRTTKSPQNLDFATLFTLTKLLRRNRPIFHNFILETIELHNALHSQER